MTNFAHQKVSQPTHSQQTNLIQRGCKMNWKHKPETKQLTTKQKTYLIMDSNSNPPPPNASIVVIPSGQY